MEGIIPVVERNQGLLSLLALVFALGLAYWEYRLLLHRDRLERREDVRTVSDLLQGLIQRLDDLHADGPPYQNKFELSRVATDSALAMRSIANGRRQSAAFIAIAYDAARLVDDFGRQLSAFDRQSRVPESWRSALIRKRDEISALLKSSNDVRKTLGSGPTSRAEDQ